MWVKRLKTNNFVADKHCGSQSTGIGALSWLAPVILLLSALLTAGYLLQITIKAFFKKEAGADAPAVKEPMAMTMVLAVLALVALVVLVESAAAAETLLTAWLNQMFRALNSSLLIQISRFCSFSDFLQRKIQLIGIKSSVKI